MTLLPFCTQLCVILVETCQYIQWAVPVDNKVNSEHKLGKDQELEEPGQQQLKSLGVIISVLGPTNSTLVQKNHGWTSKTGFNGKTELCQAHSSKNHACALPNPST